MGWTSPSLSRPISNGAPAAAATSPSPVQSTVTRAVTTTGPDLVSNTTSPARPGVRTPLAKACSMYRTPAPSSRSRATCLKTSGSKGTVYPVSGDGSNAPSACTSRSMTSMCLPATTGSPSPWSVGNRLTSPSWGGCGRRVWKDIHGITRAAVALPPRNPYRSTRTTSAPASAAASAAPMPAGPPPTTRTSASAACNAERGGNVNRSPATGRVNGGTLDSLLLDGPACDRGYHWRRRPRQDIEDVPQRGGRPGLEPLDPGPYPSGVRVALVPEPVDGRQQRSHGVPVEAARRLDAQCLREVGDLAGVGQRQERHSGESGEDQEVQPHADREVHVLHQNKDVAGPVRAVEAPRAGGSRHAGQHGMTLADVTALHGDEHHLAAVAVHREVGDRGEGGVLGVDCQIRCRSPWFPYGHGDQPSGGVHAVVDQFVGRDGNGTQQQCRVGHHLDGPLDADLLQDPLALLVAHGHPGHRRDDLAYDATVLGRGEWPDAEGVPDRRHAVPVGRPHVPEVLRGLAVVQQPTTTEDEDVEPGDLLVHGVTPTPAGVDDPIDRMRVAGVRGVAGEHDDLGEGQGLSHGGEHRGQDGLVADVEPAVGTEQSDGRHPGSPVDVSPVSGKKGRRRLDAARRPVGGEDRLRWSAETCCA